MNFVIIGEAAETFKSAISKRRDDIVITTYGALDIFAQALSSREIACDRILLSEDAVTGTAGCTERLMAFKTLLEEHYTGVQVVLLLKKDTYLQECTDIMYDTDLYTVFCVGSSLNVPFLVHTAAMDMAELRKTYSNFLQQAVLPEQVQTYETLPVDVAADEEFEDEFATLSQEAALTDDDEYAAYTADFDDADDIMANMNTPTVDYDGGLNADSDLSVTDEESAIHNYEGQSTKSIGADATFDFNADDFDYDSAVHEYNNGVSNDEDTFTDDLPVVADDFDSFGTFSGVDGATDNATDSATFVDSDADIMSDTFADNVLADDNITDKQPDVTSVNTPITQPTVAKPGRIKHKHEQTIGRTHTTAEDKGKSNRFVKPQATPPPTQAVAASAKYTQITAGKTVATIVVTGDRRAGLTTTAMSIAEHFAQYVPTLYVDYDTQYRGSLNYLSIKNLASTSNIVQNGLGVLKPGRNIRTVTYKADEVAPFDSLVSLPNFALTDEQLIQTQLQLFYQHEYTVVVIDCPFTNLYLLEDVLGQATIYICVTGDMANSSSTLLTLDALNPAAKSLFQLAKPMSEKGIAMLSRAQYLLTGADTQQFGAHMAYLNELYDLSDNDINWTKLSVVGTTRDLSAVLQQMV